MRINVFKIVLLRHEIPLANARLHHGSQFGARFELFGCFVMLERVLCHMSLIVHLLRLNFTRVLDIDTLTIAMDHTLVVIPPGVR